MKVYRKACNVVYQMAAKYGCNRAWIWELLDEHFGFRYGEAALMDLSEIEELKDIIEDLINE